MILNGRDPGLPARAPLRSVVEMPVSAVRRFHRAGLNTGLNTGSNRLRKLVYSGTWKERLNEPPAGSLENRAGHRLLHLSGNMTKGPEPNSLGSLVRDRVERGDKKSIFDLSGVEPIGSVGGLALIRCFFAAREANAGICLAGASHAVERLFRATHLDTLVVPFFSNTAAASEHSRHGRGEKTA